MRKIFFFLVALAGFPACATMHRSAIGEVLPEEGAAPPERVEIGVSEIGVDRENLAEDVANIAKSTGNNTMKGVGQTIEFVTWATTFSPRTGNPTTTDTWADDTVSVLRAHCKDGRITGIQTLRESAEYPYVSGEIVRVRAVCYRTGG